MGAVRDLLEAPERMTITRTESMVIIITGDGRTTRLATDNSRVKDESTGIERRSRWEADTLVSEISGTRGGKITERYGIDPESHRLVVTLQVDGGNRRRSDDRDQEYGALQGDGSRRRVSTHPQLTAEYADAGATECGDQETDQRGDVGHQQFPGTGAVNSTGLR